jgi:L-glyceraldehyde 3-phosphate reductase
MGLEYVDIFYSHRFDPDTPIEETMSALAHAVRQGKALYAGISNYSAEKTAEAAGILRSLGVPVLIHQVRYSMFGRDPEPVLFAELENQGIGCIAFSPLAQGLLTDRYLAGIPNDSRAAKPSGFLKPADVTDEKRAQVVRLKAIAEKRGQSLAQMAIAWVLRIPVMASALVGASRVRQLEDNVRTIENLSFSAGELETIDRILGT